MADPPTYTFTRVKAGDLALLNGWRRHAHVAAWWGMHGRHKAADLDDPRVARFLVSLDGAPFAFVQDYDPQGWKDHHFYSLGPGARGLDQYIGVPGMIGCGYGTAFLRQRIDALFARGVPVLASDPHPDNTRAISVYAKLGFMPNGPVQDTQWGRIRPMELTA